MPIQIKHTNTLLNRSIRHSNPEIILLSIAPKWTNNPITFTPHSKESLSKLITFKNSIGEN